MGQYWCFAVVTDCCRWECPVSPFHIFCCSCTWSWSIQLYFPNSHFARSNWAGNREAYPDPILPSLFRVWSCRLWGNEKPFIPYHGWGYAAWDMLQWPIYSLKSEFCDSYIPSVSTVSTVASNDGELNRVSMGTMAFYRTHFHGGSSLVDGLRLFKNSLFPPVRLVSIACCISHFYNCIWNATCRVNFWAFKFNCLQLESRVYGQNTSWWNIRAEDN